MDTARVVERIARMQLGELGAANNNYEFWEGDDGEAHFKVARYQMPLVEHQKVICLWLDGPWQERQRLAAEFVAALGEPASVVAFANDQQTDFYAWTEGNL